MVRSDPHHDSSKLGGKVELDVFEVLLRHGEYIAGISEEDIAAFLVLGHILLLCRLTLDEVKHGWRALHTEETAHQSAQCSCTYLHFFRRSCSGKRIWKGLCCSNPKLS